MDQTQEGKMAKSPADYAKAMESGVQPTQVTEATPFPGEELGGSVVQSGARGLLKSARGNSRGNVR